MLGMPSPELVAAHGSTSSFPMGSDPSTPCTKGWSCRISFSWLLILL